MHYPVAAIAVIVVGLGFGSDSAFSQRTGCSRSQEMKALDEADQLRTWDALYKSYKAYRLCDDGAIAEGYSDSVGRILSHHWRTLARFASLAKGDVGFRKFVLRYIDETGDTEDLSVIEKNAKGRCPAGFSALCGDISRKARQAITDSANVSH